jgi:ubiquitin-protein ligase E3 C
MLLLFADGANVRVTAENLSLYLTLVADYRLNREIASSCSAFLGGLSVLIEQAWLRMFNDRELQQLISGSATGNVDMGDLRQNVDLGGGYHADHPVMHMLWEVLEGFDKTQRALFLKFVTGCSRCVFGTPCICCYLQVQRN